VNDKDDRIFIFCSEDQADADAWVCAVKDLLGIPCQALTTKGVEVVEEEKNIKPILIMPLSSPNCEKDWNYASHGKDWKCRCATGKEQSPINIENTNILPLK